MNLISRCLCSVVAGGLFVAHVGAADLPELKTPQDKINYTIGVNIANSFKQQDIEINLDLVIRGMKDAYGDGDLLLNSQELRKATMQHQTNVRKKLGARARTTATESNRKASEAFLDANKGKEGVVTLPSGLQYRIIKEADGKKPGEDDTVTYRFSGTLITGKEFDSTSRTGDPKPIKVKDVAIPGLKEGLKLMPAGSRWQLFIPAQLAYGEPGLGQSVGPNQAIIYDVELQSVN